MGLGAAMAADPKPESGGLQVLQGEPTPLTFWNREVAILRADIDGISPAERVKRIKDKIDFILATKPGDKAQAFPGTFANLTGYWIKIDGNPIFGLVPEDAAYVALPAGRASSQVPPPWPVGACVPVICVPGAVISGGMILPGRSAKRPSFCFRSSIMPSAKHGALAARKSSMNCRCTVSFGRRG